MNEQIANKLPDYGTRSDEITIFAGPCSVESEEQFDEVAECIASLGLTWVRGGAFKPRTNPHSFQGLGEEALQIMKASGEKWGLKTLTEVMDSAHCELVHSYVDGLQVGARNFQNFSLLKNIGIVTAESHKMVLYKRGFAGTIAEWLAATDYLTAEGNDNVVLCERGIRTFETATRFTLAHLRCRLVRERDGKDPPRSDVLVLDEVGDAVREHAGLAGPGSREHEQRALCAEDSLFLGRVQRIDVDRHGLRFRISGHQWLKFWKSLF